MNYYELHEFSCVQSIYYKVQQSILQTGKSISKWDNFLMKWDWYYKVGQVILESRAVLRYYKVGKVIHYKVEQSLLQSGTNFLPDEYESGVEQYNKMDFRSLKPF